MYCRCPLQGKDYRKTRLICLSEEGKKSMHGHNNLSSQKISMTVIESGMRPSENEVENFTC